MAGLKLLSEAPSRCPPQVRRGIERSQVVKGRVEIKDVSIVFDADSLARTAVESVDLRIEPGELICLLGPSGCGKSTLLNAIAGFVRPTCGSITVDGDVVMGPGPDRGMVFQQHSLFPWKTVKQNIMFGPLMAGHSRGSAEGIARTFLALVGLARFGDRYPATLSGGMQQRVAIARALVNQPRILLMDEPFGALDAQTRARMQSHLIDIWRNIDITVLFITHDLDEAIYLADRILVLKAHPGEVQEVIEVPLPRPRSPHSSIPSNSGPPARAWRNSSIPRPNRCPKTKKRCARISSALQTSPTAWSNYSAR